MKDTPAINTNAGANIRYGNAKTRRPFGWSSAIRSSASLRPLSAMTNAPFGCRVEDAGFRDVVLQGDFRAGLDVKPRARRDTDRCRAERAVEQNFSPERLGQVHVVRQPRVCHGDMFRPQAK